ncbi:MAG: hypothetical protein ACI841_003791 [Planctomycetota bacterium]|jgi:uncharacterized protein
MRYETTIHHRFEAEGQPFVYAAGTAAVCGLDDTAHELLERFSVEGGADIGTWRDAEERETFEELVSFGLMKPVGEKLPITADPLPMPFPLSTLVLNVASKCNLSCTYCYEYGEDQLSALKQKPKMSAETARSAIELFLKESGGRPDLSITFFGGETLLGFEVIKVATEYALERAAEEGRTMGFSLTTNATLLDEPVIDFLTRHRFGINISIDGDKDDHDRHRTFASGRGSHGEIVPKIKELLQRNRPHGRPIGARVTVTAGSASVPAIYRHLYDEVGFDAVGFAPVTSAPGRDYELAGDGMNRLLVEFEELAEEYVAAALQGKRHGFSNLHDLLQELHQGTNKAHPCGAGLGLAAVSTEGDISPCHRFVGSKEHELGNLEDGFDAEKRSSFLESVHISNKPDCDSCFARPHCSGGCYHEAHVRYGDVSTPNLHYCTWIRSWTDLGLRCYGRIAIGNPDYLMNFEGRPNPVAESAPILSSN